MAGLTELKIRKIKPTDKIKRYYDENALYLQVHPNNKKYWRLKYYRPTDGKEDTLSLGVYSPTNTLACARASRDEARLLIAQGIDPKAQKKANKEKNDQQKSLSEIINLYLENESPNHKGHKWEKIRLTKIMRDYPKMCNKPIIQIDQTDMIHFRNTRSEHIQGVSVSREMQLLGGVFKYAIRELRVIQSSPLKDVTKPKENPHREQRITQQMIEKLLLTFGYRPDIQPVLKKHQTAWAMLFAIETAMRQSEITGMTWENIFDDHVLLPDTKNGSIRRVPLSNAAHALLDLMRGIDDMRVMTVEAGSLSTIFRKYRDKAELSEITFHDTRHEAISRMAKKMAIQDLAKISGHKDLTMLMRYYNPTTRELADIMNKPAV